MQGIFFNDFNKAYIPEILTEIYRQRIYDKYFKGRQGMTVVDIGGNIGLFTMFAYPFSKKIVTVEPTPDHFSCIEKLVEFNKYENVELNSSAISHKNGNVTFYESQNTTMNSLRPEVDNAGKSFEVHTLTMDALFEAHQLKEVDFCKIDIEGSEFEVIGSKGFQEVAPRIKALTVELHSWPGVSYSQPITTLRDLGFRTEVLNTEATVIAATR